MVSRKVIATLLGLYVVAMLAKQSEGYIAFYNPEDFRRMMEKEKNQAQKKSLQERSDFGDFSGVSGDEGQIIKVNCTLHYGNTIDMYRKTFLKGQLID
uniref:Uncharacterized protein n=1 Tax=Salvator merianae TaxID=96440 RepID=A0A8D0AWK0_SALMN